MKTKLIVSLIVGLVVIGGGTSAYFFLQNKSLETAGGVTNRVVNNDLAVTNPEEFQKTSGEVKQPGAYGCKDIFSDSDFQRIFGYSGGGYTIEEDVNGVYTLMCSYKVGQYENVLSIQLNRADIIGNRIDQTSNFNLVKGMVSTAKNVAGVGSDAYYIGNNELSVLSSDKTVIFLLTTDHRFLSSTALAKDEMAKDREAIIEIARIIDGNLTKY